MRIVYVLTSLGMGGAERQVVALAAHMEDRGHAVALMVLRPQLKQEWPTSILVFHLDMRRTLFGVAAGLLRGWKFLQEFSPEIVHSHSFHANFVARILKLFVPSAVAVSTIHNIYEGGRARMLAYRLTDCMSRRTTAVSVAATERFVSLKAVPQRKCTVVTNGIDIAEFAPQADRRVEMRGAMSVTDEFIWITAGRLVPAKDLPNLLRAYGIVRAARPQTQLWIAGQAVDADLNAVNRFFLAGHKGFMEQVRWLGLRRDMPALFDAADGFVLGSAWEGMPLVVGEAMAMGKPVVATDVGGVRELVGDAGMLVPARDSEALAAAMLEMMNRPSEDRLWLGKRARARIVAEFSIESRADDWETLYAKLLPSPK